MKKRGASLHEASLPNGKIDADHPDAVEYLRVRKFKKAAENNITAGEDRTDEIIASISADEELADKDAALLYITKIDRKEASNFLNATLVELIDTFGSNVMFRDWLKAVKLIEEVREKQLKNEETSGTLIQRDFVKTHILGLIETTYIRLLNDAPRTIAASVIDACARKKGREEIEKLIGEMLSDHLKNIKLRACRSLDRA